MQYSVTTLINAKSVEDAHDVVREMENASYARGTVRTLMDMEEVD